MKRQFPHTGMWSFNKVQKPDRQDDQREFYNGDGQYTRPIGSKFTPELKNDDKDPAASAISTPLVKECCAILACMFGPTDLMLRIGEDWVEGREDWLVKELSPEFLRLIVGRVAALLLRKTAGSRGLAPYLRRFADSIQTSKPKLLQKGNGPFCLWPHILWPSMAGSKGDLG